MAWRTDGGKDWREDAQWGGKEARDVDKGNGDGLEKSTRMVSL